MRAIGVHLPVFDACGPRTHRMGLCGWKKVPRRRRGKPAYIPVTYSTRPRIRGNPTPRPPGHAHGMSPDARQTRGDVSTAGDPGASVIRANIPHLRMRSPDDAPPRSRAHDDRSREEQAAVANPYRNGSGWFSCRRSLHQCFPERHPAMNPCLPEMAIVQGEVARGNTPRSRARRGWWRSSPRGTGWTRGNTVIPRAAPACPGKESSLLSGPRVTQCRVTDAPGMSTTDIPQPKGRSMLPLLSSPVIVCPIPFNIIRKLAALLAAGIGGIA